MGSIECLVLTSELQGHVPYAQGAQTSLADGIVYRMRPKMVMVDHSGYSQWEEGVCESPGESQVAAFSLSYCELADS